MYSFCHFDQREKSCRQRLAAQISLLGRDDKCLVRNEILRVAQDDSAKLNKFETSTYRIYLYKLMA